MPGAVELPLAASRLLWTGDYDAVIALGAVIRGDTAHFDFVAGECAAGLQRVALDTGVPVVFGVLTTDTVAQALERAGPGQTNKGYEAAVTALEMVRLLESCPRSPTTRARRDDQSDQADDGCEVTADARESESGCPPKGSLEKATLELFADADLAVVRAPTSTTGGRSTTPGSTRSGSCGPRRSPSTWPTASSTWASPAATGSRRPGPTWSRSGSCAYSKATANPIRVVLAVARRLTGHAGRGSPAGASGSRPSTPSSPAGSWRSMGVQAEVRLSYGATEAKIPDIADAVVEITETGRALAAAGLRIIGTLLESFTELVANPAAAADPVKRHAMTQLLTLLQGTLEARGKVLLKLNVSGRHWRRSSPSCPRSRPPPSPSSRARTASPSRRWCPRRR